MTDSMKLVLLGLLTIVFGVFVLGAPVVASIAVTAVTGILLLVSGGLQVVGGFTVEGTGNKVLSIVMGAVMVFLGWSFISNPLAGTVSLATLVLILFMAGGLSRIFVAWKMRSTSYFWPMLLSGVASVLLAGYVWSAATQEPQALLALIGILLGIEMLFNGFGFLFLGLFLRASKSE